MANWINRQIGSDGPAGPTGPQYTAKTYTVTVANPGSGNRYYIDGVLQDTLHLLRNHKYIIDVNDSSTNSHPFFIQTTDNGGAYDSSNLYFVNTYNFICCFYGKSIKKNSCKLP